MHKQPLVSDQTRDEDEDEAIQRPRTPRAFADALPTIAKCSKRKRANENERAPPYKTLTVKLLKRPCTATTRYTKCLNY